MEYINPTTSMYGLKEIYKALFIFHNEITGIKKESENPYFKSKYSSLETILPAIKEPLRKAGLIFIQIPTGDNSLLTRIVHVESGEFIEGVYSMKPVKDDPQGRGSCLTYMRRYALVSILGLNTESDDDGNTASDPRPCTTQHNTPQSISFSKSGTSNIKPSSVVGSDGTLNTSNIRNASETKFAHIKL